MTEYDPFPAGRFTKPDILTVQTVTTAAQRLAEFPARLRAITGTLRAEQWETKTLPAVWTVAQIVHHLADSHMNAMIRTKMALTEENPTIKPYDEGKWAVLPDNDLPASVSLELLDGIHRKWSHLFRHLDDVQLNRTYYHPGDRATVSVAEQLFMYVHHGNHHLGFIEQLINAKGWPENT